MEGQVGVARRLVRVVGTALLLPALAALALLAASRWPGPHPDPVDRPPVWEAVPEVPDLRVQRDREYGQVEGSSLRLDVYASPRATSGPRPALLLIHGGGWVEGDKDGEVGLASVLAPQGFVAFALNYRLAREGSGQYPAAVRDVQRAARWVRAHAAEFGVDPTRLGAVGLSAGGHLAALLGTTDPLDPADPNSGHVSARVDCVVDTAGPTDFTDEANPPVGPRIAEVVPRFFGGPRSALPDAYRAASPARQVTPQAAPTLICHGTADDIVPIAQSRHLDEALAAAHVDHKLVLVAGGPHVFSEVTHQRLWLDAMNAWLVEHLHP